MNEETQNKTSVETFKMNQSRIRTSVTPKNQSDAELASPTTLINEVASDGSKNTREWTAEKRSVFELKEIQPPNSLNSPNESEGNAMQKTQEPIQYNVNINQ